MKIKDNATIGNNEVLHVGNYNNYTPTLTGTGASGTWGINISGNANTLDGLDSSDFQRQINEQIVNITAPNLSSGTWTSTDGDDWGYPRIGTYAAQYNDAVGYRQWNIPSGMDTCYISQLTWSAGGYVDVHGVQGDGGLVFLRRINTKQNVENTNEGGGISNPNQHDGSTVTLAATGLSDFVAIRLTNQLGRFHMTGMSFTSNKLIGSEGTGLVHWGQLQEIPTTFTGNITGNAGTVTNVPAATSTTLGGIKISLSGSVLTISTT